MKGIELAEYQEVLKKETSLSLAKNKKIVVQLGTGGGKTIIFSSVIKSFIDKNKGFDVLVVVHRDKLLEQTRQTLYDKFDVFSESVDAKNKNILKSRVYVAMIETLMNRIKEGRFSKYMESVGLVIIDECHLGSFTKIHEFFPKSYFIGFSATPESADKKNPLCNIYKDIVVGPTIKELIEYNSIHRDRGVVVDYNYSKVDNVQLKDFAMKGKDYDQDFIGNYLSQGKKINNVINEYVKNAFGLKAICFNANVSHSIEVTKEMNSNGLNARHIDGKSPDQYKRECFDWLKKTPNAILNNVEVATTGFDDPSIECVIMNTSTKSRTKFTQICGRGARPFRKRDGTWKDRFIVLDLGDNISGNGHGEWSDFYDWKKAFFNPLMPKDGVAPKKICPECYFVNNASARKCKGKVESQIIPGTLVDCEYIFVTQNDEVYEKIEELKLIIKDSIDVAKIISEYSGYTEWQHVYHVMKMVVHRFKESNGLKNLSCDELVLIWDLFYGKAKEVLRQFNKRGSSFCKRTHPMTLVDLLRERGFSVVPEEVDLFINAIK